MAEAPNRHRPGRGSLVWPILFIGGGVILLLSNLDILPANSWALILRLWPLALILLGLDILIGRRSTLGMLVAGLITLLVVTGLIALLLLAPNVPALRQLTSPGDLRTQSLQAPLEGVQSAQVTIDWSPGENTLNAAPAGSANLIEGQVQYYGTLIFDVNTQGTQAEIILDDRFQTTGFFFPFSGEQQWNVSLHPNIHYALRLDTGSGRHDFDISGLQLNDFLLDSGSGQVDLSLPAGDYRATLDGGSGSIQVRLPQEAAVRVELQSGSGRFTTGPTLQLVSGEADDDGVWETSQFTQADQQIILVIDQGSGSITIEQ